MDDRNSYLKLPILKFSPHKQLRRSTDYAAGVEFG